MKPRAPNNILPASDQQMKASTNYQTSFVEFQCEGVIDVVISWLVFGITNLRLIAMDLGTGTFSQYKWSTATNRGNSHFHHKPLRLMMLSYFMTISACNGLQTFSNTKPARNGQTPSRITCSDQEVISCVGPDSCPFVEFIIPPNTHCTIECRSQSIDSKKGLNKQQWYLQANPPETWDPQQAFPACLGTTFKVFPGANLEVKASGVGVLMRAELIAGGSTKIILDVSSPDKAQDGADSDWGLAYAQINGADAASLRIRVEGEGALWDTDIYCPILPNGECVINSNIDSNELGDYWLSNEDDEWWINDQGMTLYGELGKIDAAQIIGTHIYVKEVSDVELNCGRDGDLPLSLSAQKLYFSDSTAMHTAQGRTPRSRMPMIKFPDPSSASEDCELKRDGTGSLAITVAGNCNIQCISSPSTGSPSSSPTSSPSTGSPSSSPSSSPSTGSPSSSPTSSPSTGSPSFSPTSSESTSSPSSSPTSTETSSSPSASSTDTSNSVMETTTGSPTDTLSAIPPPTFWNLFTMYETWICIAIVCCIVGLIGLVVSNKLRRSGDQREDGFQQPSPRDLPQVDHTNALDDLSVEDVQNYRIERVQEDSEHVVGSNRIKLTEVTIHKASFTDHNRDERYRDHATMYMTASQGWKKKDRLKWYHLNQDLHRIPSAQRK